MKKISVYAVGVLLLIIAVLSVGCNFLLEPVPVTLEFLTITVQDETGATIPDAVVTFGSNGRTATTDASGQVEYATVVMGEYEVTVEHTNGEELTRTVSVAGDSIDFLFARVVEHPDPSMEYPLSGSNWDWANYYGHTGGAWITGSDEAYSGTAFIRNPQGSTSFWNIWRPAGANNEEGRLAVEIGKRYRPTVMVRNNGEESAEVILWFRESSATPSGFGSNPVTVSADGQWHQVIGGNVGVAQAELLDVRADFAQTDQLDFDHVVVYEVLNY